MKKTYQTPETIIADIDSATMLAGSPFNNGGGGDPATSHSREMDDAAEDLFDSFEW